MSTTTTVTREGLVRGVGTGSLTASIVNVTIGAGIFALPAIVAADLGAAAPAAYIACGVAMMLIVLCFAESGSRVSTTGGLYAYAGTAFGPFIGFLVGVLFWFTTIAAGASVINVFASTAARLVPAVGTTTGRALLLIATYAVLAAINIRGLRMGTRVVNTITVAKLVPLLLIIVVGTFFIHPAHLVWPTVPGTNQIGKTAIVLIFAFVGIEIALAPSGEIENPSRTVPRAVLLALGSVTLLYIALQLVAQGVLGADLVRDRAAPLAAVAARIAGDGGRLLVLIGTVVSTFGYVSGDMLGSPRAPFAMAEAGSLPNWLARVHPRFHTPYVAIVVHAVISGVFAVTGSFEKLAVIANVSILTVYFICCMATIRLKRLNVRQAGPPFVLWGGPTIPIVAGVVIIWLLSSATRREFTAVGTTIVIASIVYAAQRMLKVRS